jgi:hypothetical protein
MKTRGATSGNIYVNLQPRNSIIRQRFGKNSKNCGDIGSNIDDTYNYQNEENDDMNHYASPLAKNNNNMIVKSPRDNRGNCYNNAAVEKYIENCALFDVKIDTSIVISLRSG